MSDIFSNALNGLSDAIHSAGKSSIGQMAEAAALTYFLGPAGAEFSIPTAAGLAGGITNLVNGGNLGSALTAGAMGWGLGSLSGVGEANLNAAKVPVVDMSIDTPVGVGADAPYTDVNGNPIVRSSANLPASVSSLGVANTNPILAPASASTAGNHPPPRSRALAETPGRIEK